MTVAIFGLAWLAALNPKLLAVDLILMGSRRPTLMFIYFLLGGIGIALAIGLLDVFVLRADALQAQGSSSAGLDLGLGIPLLAIGGLLASGWQPRRRKPSPAGRRRRGKISSWARSVMQEPRLGLVVVTGVVAGAPGVSYLAALHLLVTGNSPAASQVIAVLVFVIIEFVLVIVPFVFMVSRPAATERAVKRFRDWLVGHARQLAATAALLAGGYMVISGALRLVS